MNIGLSLDNFVINQILCLSKNTDIAQNNMKQIEKSISLSAHNDNYRVNYFYSSSLSLNDDMNLLNQIIITHRGVICFSGNQQFGLYYKNEQLIQFYLDIYHQYEQNTHPLITVINSLKKEFDVIGKNFMNSNVKNGWYLDKELCLVSLINEKLLSKYLQINKESNPEFYHEISNYITVYQQYIKTKKLGIYTTLSGVRRFLETGKVTEFPNYILKKIQMKDRIILVQHLLDLIHNDNIFILKDKYEQIDYHFHIFIFHTFGYILISDNENRMKYINLNELSIIEQLYDFMNLLQVENIYENNIYTKEEAVTRIQEMLDKFISI